jgi:CheY-like chemotaxis protein
VSPRGYCKLESTQRQDDNGDGGSSDFQFGIAGKVISVLTVEDVAREQRDAASSKKQLVDDVHVIIIDDQSIIRKMMQRSIENTASGTSGWTFEGFPTAESAQPRIRELKNDSRALVVTDQNMASVGGVLTGTDLIRWMVALPFKGTIVSAAFWDGEF